MRPLTLFSFLLATTFAAGCAAPVDDDGPESTPEHNGSTASALTSGYYSITPIPIPGERPLNDVIAADSTGIYYLSSRWAWYVGSYYTAVHLSYSGAILGESAMVFGTAPKPKSLSISNGSVVFLDGDHRHSLPLDASIKPTVTTVLLFPLPITTVKPVVTYRGSLPFSIASQVAFDGGGGVGFDGGGGVGLVSSSYSSFEPGGGLGYYSFGATSYEGGGGVGLWAASASTPQLARVNADGSATAVSLVYWAIPGTAAYTAAIPRHVRSVDTSAVVVTADLRVLVVK